MFPIKCIKRGAVERFTVHSIAFHKEIRIVLVLPEKKI